MYIKVNKTKARNLFNQGKTVYIVPCKVRFDFNNMWIEPYEINKSKYEYYDVDTFDIIINSFEYHNCNYELGYYASYYVQADFE